MHTLTGTLRESAMSARHAHTVNNVNIPATATVSTVVTALASGADKMEQCHCIVWHVVQMSSQG